MDPKIDQQTISSFERDGFVVVEDLLDKSELERFGAAVDTAVARRSAGDTRDVEEKTLYEQSFIQCMRMWEDDPEVRPLTFHPRIGATAAALLGADAVRIWQDQALYKEAGGRETDAHQDLPFWPIREPDLVSAWIPFEASTRESGAMAYVPGSHRSGLNQFVDITHLMHPEPYDILADPAIADTQARLGRGPCGLRGLPSLAHRSPCGAQPDGQDPASLHDCLHGRRLCPQFRPTSPQLGTRSRRGGGSALPAPGFRLPGRVPKATSPSRPHNRVPERASCKPRTTSNPVWT